MSLNLGKFQMTEVTDFSGLVTANQLGLLFGNKPQLLQNSITKFLAGSSVRTISTELEKYPLEILETDDDFTWKLSGHDEKNMTLEYAYVTAGSPITTGSAHGKNGQDVYLVFSERYFSDVNVLVGHKNEIYQFQVKEEPLEKGDGWHYRTRLLGAGAKTGVNYTELLGGTKWSKDFSAVEDTLSMKGGGVVYTTPIDMRNSLTTLRMQEKVPGNMMDRKVAGTLVGTTPNGEMTEFAVWMLYAEWEFEKQWEREKSRAYMFARSNRNEDGSYSDHGKSGYFIKQGAGIREQMEVSNVIFANDINVDLLESIMTDMVEGREDVQNVAEFMIRTGRRGASKISKAAQSAASGWSNLTIYNPPTIQKVSSDLHSNSFSGGFQFTEFLLPNNIILKVEVDNSYDNKVRNKIKHPEGGVAESYRMDIFYMGNREKPNIKRLGIKMGDIRGYLAGFRNPWTGEQNNGHMGTMEDGSTYTRYTGLGAVIIDPSRTAVILPSVLE